MINSTWLFGTIITNDLRWDENTESSFGTSIKELKNIYILFVRSQLEHSATVWHSSLIEDNRNNFDRVQKSAVKIILGDKYKHYQQALEYLNI